MNNPLTDNRAAKILEHPENWKTGDEPMTAAQDAYLHTLARETGEQIESDLSKAEASKKIEELQDETGRDMTVAEKQGKKRAVSNEPNNAKNEPTPSSSAAAAAGTVGPGAVAAAQKSSQSNTEPVSLGSLSDEDAMTLRRLAEQMGGTEALGRWLRMHADEQ